MKKHCVAAILMLATGAAFADCKPVVGHFEAQAVKCEAPFCTAGRVWGGIQGNYEFVMTGIVPSADIGGVRTIQFFAGRSTIHLKSGDELVGTDTGAIDLLKVEGGFASLITFDGGSGTIKGASGQIRLRGEFSPADGTTSGDYLGSLCTP